MAADKQIKELIQTMEDAVASFQKQIPSIQKGMFSELSNQLKDISTKDGRILNSIQNLKLIAQFKNKLERIILSPEYKSAVKEFVGAFDTVSDLQKDYFAAFNLKFKPSKTLPIIKKMAIDKTVNDLVGQGLQANIVDKVQAILQQNTTSGGSYAAMTEELRNHILTNETGDGAMERYSRTITTDAINQYSAQYHDALAQDLNMNWGRYVGSNLTTTREFCEYLTKKEWVHRDELPTIIEGNINGHECKLSKSTGLPLGMIQGTNADNFKVRRGGYNCGHQFFWTPDASVPENIKNSLGKEHNSNDTNNGEQPLSSIPVDLSSKKPNASIKFVDTKKVQNYPREFNTKIFDKLTQPTGFEYHPNTTSFFTPSTRTVTIGTGDRFQKSPVYQESIVYHEFGHAIHRQNGVIDDTDVSTDFQEVYNKMKATIEGKERDIHNQIMGDLNKVMSDWSLSKDHGFENPRDYFEQASVVADILGSLTKGKFGGGHEIAYYKNSNGAYKEIFAHGNANHFQDNPLLDEYLPEAKEILAEFFRTFYEE